VGEPGPYSPRVIDDPGTSFFEVGQGIFSVDNLEPARGPEEAPKDTDISIGHHELGYRWPGDSGVHP
jgi:hypothetical protein